MLTPDLLNELLSLVDDSSTFYSIALASKITVQLAERQTSIAKRRYSIWKYDELVRISYLPSGVKDGPYMHVMKYYVRVCHWNNGAVHGKFKEWHRHTYARRIWTYVDSFIHGPYRLWSDSGHLYEEGVMSYNEPLLTIY